MKLRITKEEQKEMLEAGIIDENSDIEIIDSEEKAVEDEEGKEKKPNSEEGSDLDPKEKERQKKLADFYYKQLVADGILEEGLEVNNLKELNKKVVEVKEKAKEEFAEELPDSLKEQIEAYRKGIDPNKIKQVTNNLEVLKKIDDAEIEKDKKLALDLVRALMQANGDDEDYIKSRLEVIEDSETFALEGKRAKKLLMKKEEDAKAAKLKEEEKRAELQQKELKKFEEGIKKALNNKDVFWGIEPTEAEKKKLELAILNPKEYYKKHKDIEPLEEITKKPEVIAQLYYLYITGAFGEKGNLSKFKVKAKTEATKEIENLLQGSSNVGFSNTEDAEFEDGLSFMSKIASNLKGGI